jgi:hypothetical protein
MAQRAGNRKLFLHEKLCHGWRRSRLTGWIWQSERLHHCPQHAFVLKDGSG